MLSVQFKVDNVPFLFIHITKVGKMLRIFNNGNKKILQILADIKYQHYICVIESLLRGRWTNGEYNKGYNCFDIL